MLDHVSTKPFKRFWTIPRHLKYTIIMVQHPEVLWAQRSSEFDSEKVHSVHLNASISRLTLSQERDLCHRELARHPGKNPRVQLDLFFHLFQGKSRRVRFFFSPQLTPLSSSSFSPFFTSPYHQSIQGHPGKGIRIRPRLLC